MDDIIILDDEMHPNAQTSQPQPTVMNFPTEPSSSRNQIDEDNQAQRSGRRVKRNHNGTRTLSAAEMHPRTITASSGEVSTSYASSIIINGQDIYYIEEVQDSEQTVLVPDEDVQYVQPSYVVNEHDVESDLEEAQDVEQLLADAVEFNTVEPMELSEIWNDLITANPEVLILLELSDLKHHILDARKIELQIRDMACEYCGRIFPDIHTWDRHVRKIHFQTDLFECDSCDGKFKYFARFKDHLNGHTAQRIYQCDECHHQYAFRMGYLVHKIVDHMKLNGIYVCPKCNLDLRDALNYKLHIASHIDFGVSIQQTSDAAPAVSATVTKSRISNAVKVKPPVATTATNVPFFAKENERNRFLNVFESFSKKRKLELDDCNKKQSK